MKRYHFCEALMLRTPAFSYVDYDLSKIGQLIHDSFFKGALYLANPALYHLIAVKLFNWDSFTAKEKMSLTKYYNRMSFRPTPFGAFSAFTMVNWGNTGQVKLADSRNARLHLLVDQEANLKLVNGSLRATGTEEVLINPTLYRVANEFRFIKTNHEDGSSLLAFSLESLEVNQLLLQIFDSCADQSVFVSAIVPLVLSVSRCNPEAALDYVNFLLNAQWLVFKSIPNITGQDFLLRIINDTRFNTTPAGREIGTLYTRIIKTTQVDDRQLKALGDHLNTLVTQSNQPAAANVFYSGLEHTAVTGQLNSHWQEPLRETLIAINRLTIEGLNPALEQFIQRFTRKFDQQKVPLLQAMDPHIGVGYAELEHDTGSPLLDRLHFGKNASSPAELQWSTTHQLLLFHWLNKTSPHEGIILNKEDINQLPERPKLNVPNLSVMFRLVDDAQIFLEAIGGGPATALIGRFTIWSEEVYRLAKQIAHQEQTQHPDVLFAEIAQLSDTHTDNINRRRQCYDHEIPINAVSLLPKENQILLSDLLIYSLDGKIMLESVSRKKMVIPRLSSAYNYTRNELAVFRFLCDLQYQGRPIPIVPDLEQFFPGLSHYPRLSYEQVVLSPAKWYLKKEELIGLTVKNRHLAVQQLQALKSKLQWPDVIAIVKQDQQLVINLSHPVEADFFLQAIQGATQLLVQEFLLPPENLPPVVDENGRGLINQLVAFLYNEDKAYSDKVIAGQSRADVRQTGYMLGSKWLYLKLYCHPAISNELLAKKLLPLIEKLKVQLPIHWFYIRYRDDGYHIRLRIKTEEQHIGQVIKTLKRGLVKEVRIQLVRQYQADTYCPEWERYGADLMNFTEHFFEASSELVLGYIKITLRPKFTGPYYSLAFVSVSEMIGIFISNLDDQIHFIQQMAESFYQEFADDKLLKVGMNEKYRELKAQLKSLLADDHYYIKLKLADQHRDFVTKLQPLAHKDFTAQPGRRTKLLADLIHMHLNRLFVDEQRKKELVVYYCLLKLKTTVKASAKK